MAENNLPPHFFYLALQESDFEAPTVGAKTKYGYAKGIWQLIPNTAKYYDLKIGPFHKDPVYDPTTSVFILKKQPRLRPDISRT